MEVGGGADEELGRGARRNNWKGRTREEKLGGGAGSKDWTTRRAGGEKRGGVRRRQGEVK